MEKEVLRAIEGIDIYPIVSMFIFLALFIGVIIWAVKADKNFLTKMSRLPLDNNNNLNSTERKVDKFKLLILLCSLFIPAGIFAQSPAGENKTDPVSEIAGAMVFVLVAVLFILLYIFSKEKYIYKPGGKKVSLFNKLWQRVTQSVPVEREEDILFDHDFDGIKELDNKVPPWFNVLFYGTVLFAAIYMLNYHVIGSGNVMLDEYVDEVRIANEKREELIRSGALINENSVTLLTDNASLQNGKNIFMANCVPCHGPDGGGTVGPNLTDNYWIHGGGIKNVFKIVSNGVPIKGMISWKTMLNPKKIQEVSSYVISLQGTNPPTGKPPEGNPWSDTTQTTADTLKIKKDSLKAK